MEGETQRAALWLYRQANRLGLLSIAPIQRIFEWAYFSYKRHLEDPFFNLARKHPELFRGGHAVDVGANIGYTASVFAEAIDPGFRVWAIEPGTENFRRLKATIAAQRLEANITPIHSAVGDRVGWTDLRLNAFHPGDHRVIESGKGERPSGEAVERVELTTVDEAVRARRIAPVAFIKVDVQGYELNVCRGMTKTLDANPGAAVAIEYSPGSLREYEADPRSLPEFFADRGYGAFRIMQSGKLVPVEAVDLSDSTSGAGYANLLFSKVVGEERR